LKGFRKEIQAQKKPQIGHCRLWKVIARILLIQRYGQRLTHLAGADLQDFAEWLADFQTPGPLVEPQRFELRLAIYSSSSWENLASSTRTAALPPPGSPCDR
jgi:hypothetical protein